MDRGEGAPREPAEFQIQRLQSRVKQYRSYKKPTGIVESFKRNFSGEAIFDDQNLLSMIRANTEGLLETKGLIFPEAEEIAVRVAKEVAYRRSYERAQNKVPGNTSHPFTISKNHKEELAKASERYMQYAKIIEEKHGVPIDITKAWFGQMLRAGETVGSVLVPLYEGERQNDIAGVIDASAANVRSARQHPGLAEVNMHDIKSIAHQRDTLPRTA